MSFRNAWFRKSDVVKLVFTFTFMTFTFFLFSGFHINLSTNKPINQKLLLKICLLKADDHNQQAESPTCLFGVYGFLGIY